MLKSILLVLLDALIIFIVFFNVIIASCILQFTFTPLYPDELPDMKLESYENISEESADELSNFMTDLVSISSPF